MRRSRYLAVTTAIICATALSVSVPAAAEPMFGITTTNSLIRFDTDDPDTLLSTTAVTGLQAGETIVGMDFRPATGGLFAVGSSSRLYTINISTAVATQVGTGTFSTVLDGTDFGVDFNPVPDRIRVVSNTEQNLRINPTDGTVLADTALAYDAGDANTGADPAVSCAAYVNNFNGAAFTTLFGVDITLSNLVRQGGEGGTASPNGGLLFTLGKIPVATTLDCGLDSTSFTGTMFASLTSSVSGASSLYEIGLGDGHSSLPRGTIGSGVVVEDISAPIFEETVPTVAITSPTRARVSTNRTRITIAGTASDTTLLDSVQVSIRGGQFRDITGTTAWSTVVPLRLGRNVVQVKSIDIWGNESAVSTVTINRRR